MMRLVIISFLMVCGVSSMAYAVDIYQWKDEAGIVHFTDNAMNVPTKYRKVSKRKVHKLRVSGGSEGWGGKNKSERAWLDKCAACHTTGKDGEGKLGLGFLAVNAQTKFPATMDEIIPKLRNAVNGNLAEMPALDVSDDVLKQVATFILGAK